MKKLKDLVDEQSHVHQQSNYSNEDPNVQTVYDNAIQNGQNIIDGTTGEPLNKNQIDNAIQNIELAKGDLHGEQNYNMLNKMRIMKLIIFQI